MNSTTYEFLPVTSDYHSCQSYFTLLSEVFSSNQRFSAQYLHWQYAKNPLGEVLGFNAYCGQVLAAHYVCLPITAVVCGKEQRGLLSLNTATQRNHRGKKLFVSLAEKTYQLAAQSGYSFVIGVANAASSQGFLRTLKFQLVRQLDAKIILGPVHWKQAETAVNDARDLEFSRCWSPQLLTWRLGEPGAKYKRRQAEAGSLLLPFAATGVLGIDVLLGRFTPEQAGPEESIGQLFSSSRVSVLKLFLGLDPELDWSRTLHFSIPNRLRPSPLNLIYRDLTGDNRQLDPERVRIWGCDFDAY